MKTVADRLTRARELQGRSIRSLQQELHEAGVPGSSYANVHAYFGGKTPPTVEFLHSAAQALGVRAAWLAFEDGEMTEPETTRERTATGAVHAILETGALKIEGQGEKARDLMAIVMGTNRFPDIPQGAKDIMTRFLWDMLIHHPSLFVNSAAGRVDEQKLVPFAKEWFPTRVPGSYGEVMATVLAHAQVAYLKHFGSDPTTTTED